MIPSRGLKPDFPWWLAATVLVALLAAFAIFSSDLYSQVFRTVSRGLGITVLVTLIAFTYASLIGLGLALMALSSSLVRKRHRRTCASVRRLSPQRQQAW